MRGLARRVKKLTAETADAATRPEGLQHLSAEQLLQLFDGQEDPDHPDLPSRATIKGLSLDDLCRAMGNYRRSMNKAERWRPLNLELQRRLEHVPDAALNELIERCLADDIGDERLVRKVVTAEKPGCGRLQSPRY